MTERALKDLGWFDFRAAAWWLGLLYRRPGHFREVLEELSKMRMLRAGIILITYALIYAIFIAAGSGLLLGGLGLPLQESAGKFQEFAGWIAVGIAFGIAFGIVLG